MARTKHYMNWKSCTIVHGSGPTTITLTEITNVEFMINDEFVQFKGDGNIYATVMALANASRGVRITSGDLGRLAVTIPHNTPCTVTLICHDAVNGSGSGALTFVLSNALKQSISPSGAQNVILTDTVTFMSYSSDGTTSPLAITEAS